MSTAVVETIGEVFVYTPIHANRDEQNENVPNSVSSDVIRVRVDPSVMSIPAYAFNSRKKLTEVELCEGLVEIGERSFMFCDHSITNINIPNSLRRIRGDAFNNSLRCLVRLHDGIESIGNGAFSNCIFTNFRVPPLITFISGWMLQGCKSMFSLELPTNISEIENHAFDHCYCLRNVAFPPNAVFGNTFIGTGMDLQQLFGSDASIIWNLKHRFDKLPIHSIVYYLSYNQGVLQDIIAAINMRSGQCPMSNSKLDLTGYQQDCLGMTPLHILACSSVHDLEVYRVIVENYPSNLITEDRWGGAATVVCILGGCTK
jgi:hypothetical protein